MMDPMYPEGSGPLHGVCDPTMNGISLEEMIDSDIKGGDFDDMFPGGGAADAFPQDMDQFTLLDDFKVERNGCGMTGLIVDQSSSQTSIPSSMWDNIQNFSSLNAPAYTSSSSSGYMEDLCNGSAGSNIMVNPANVMPIHPHPAHHGSSTSSATNSLSINTTFPASPYVQQRLGGAASSPHLMSPASSYHVSAEMPSYARQQRQPPSPVVVHGSQHPMLVTSQQHASSTQHHQGNVVRPKTVKPPVGTPVSNLQRVPSVGSAASPASGGPHSSSSSTSSGTTTTTNSSRKKNQQKVNKENEGGSLSEIPKPGYSYSCLIALSLKNSVTGQLSVSEIYKFMCEHFPYFRTAPNGWKNSVRHNLSLNKCFEKIEKPNNSNSTRKGCLWAMNPDKVQKMDDEILKWSKKDAMAIKCGMANPNHLVALERGEMVKDYNANTRDGGSTNSGGVGIESEDEDDPRTPTSVSSLGSQGYDSAGSDFVELDGLSATFNNPIPDSSLPELHLQASGGIYEELGDDRLHFGNVVTSTCLGGVGGVSVVPPTSASVSLSTSGASASSTITSGGQVQQPQVANVRGGSGFYPTTSIQANYAITPAAATGGVGTVSTTLPHTLVVQRQDGHPRLFSVGGPANLVQ